MCGSESECLGVVCLCVYESMRECVCDSESMCGSACVVFVMQKRELLCMS